jgi:hypothetical protein
MSFLEDRNRLRIEELRVEPGDKPRRLDQGTLEHCWPFQSQDASLELPIWAKGDKVLQQIISTKSPSPASPVHSASYRSQSSSLTDLNIGQEMTMSDDRADTITNVGMDPKLDLQTPPLVIEKHPVEEMTRAESTFRNPQPSTQTQPPSSTKRASRPKRGGKPRWQQKRLSTVTKIRKMAPNPARGTRSHRLTKFYELKLDGMASTLLPG